MSVSLAKLPLTLYVGLAGIVVATTLQIVGTATTYWNHFYSDDTSLGVFTYHAGLFKQCIDEKCYDMTSESGYNSVRALTILAIVGGFLAGCLMLTFLSKLRMGTLQSKSLATSALVFCILSAKSSLIGCIIYGLAIGKANSDIMSFESSRLQLHYSFFLCLTAGILFIPHGILVQCGASSVLASMRNEEGLIVNEAIMGYPPAVQITQTGMYPYPQQRPGKMFQGQGQYPAQMNSPYAPNPAMAYGPPPPQQQQLQMQNREMTGVTVSA